MLTDLIVRTVVREGAAESGMSGSSERVDVGRRNDGGRRPQLRGAIGGIVDVVGDGQAAVAMNERLEIFGDAQASRASPGAAIVTCSLIHLYTLPLESMHSNSIDIVLKVHGRTEQRFRVFIRDKAPWRPSISSSRIPAFQHLIVQFAALLLSYTGLPFSKSCTSAWPSRR